MKEKIMRCGGVSIRADEVLFAIANTGDTSEVFLMHERGIVEENRGEVFG